ncbi:MAG: hypothetical protein WC279_12420 [Sulfurimonas sp.]|jgi:hypothetical protein|uniref:hypothetical protein n=1 Tax=Sulfurimonas sp. TaxID=2022749 RepID=UPI001BBFB6D9|nr:hypothetical protein [Sulfurimonas sp.]
MSEDKSNNKGYQPTENIREGYQPKPELITPNEPKPNAGYQPTINQGGTPTPPKEE